MGTMRAFLSLVLGLVLGLGLALEAHPQQRMTTDTSATRFSYTSPGAVQQYTVPTGITQLIVTACGASGGNGQSYVSVTSGGSGGCISALVPVTGGATLYVYVGGAGKQGIAASFQGYNGGGLGGQGSWFYPQGAGGGASDVRTIESDRSSRLISAGGGAGGGWYTRGGDGGGPVGMNSPSGGASGGSITAAGVGKLVAQNGGTGVNVGNGGNGGNGGGGGGAGWFGGAGGDSGGGGAGGSSYIITGSTVYYNTQGSNSGTDGSVSITVVGQVIESQELADAAVLCDLYDTVSSKSLLTNWCKKVSGTYTPGPCNTATPWRGVTCSSVSSTSRVTSLALSTLSLYGSLPTTIAGLDALTSLSIQSCKFTGTIPDQLFSLTNLAVLSLDSNNFFESIPTAVGSLTQLRSLSFASNELTGTLPDALGSLYSLTQLYLNNNKITGSIPSAMGYLSGLKILSLKSNKLAGEVPSTFGSMYTVQQLQLNDNKFTGSIPPALAYLSTLTLLDLSSNNKLTGQVSTSYCFFPSGATLNVVGDSKLTCYPSCLSSRASFYRDASLAVCSSGSTDVTTSIPTQLPTAKPTRLPTPSPSTLPSAAPSVFQPTLPPTLRPSLSPTLAPTLRPTYEPTTQPSGQPTGQPTYQPTNPTSQPTYALQTLVRCNVTMAITGSGITLATFKDSTASAAFTKALAKAINLASGNTTQLRPAAITIAAVTPVSTRRELSGPMFGSKRVGQRLLTDGATVTVTIASSNQQLGSPDATEAYATLSSAVSSALTDTTFGTQLDAAKTGTSLAAVSAAAAPPYISAASYSVLHSANPTGTPTSSPSRMVCSSGYRHDLNSPRCTACDAGTSSLFDSNQCFDCAVGQAAPYAGSPACINCAVGSYSSSRRSAKCTLCQWPSYTAFPGSTTCSAACVCASGTWVILFYVLAFVVYGGSLILVGVAKSPSLALFSILPALDIVSDVQYIIVTTFYTKAIFVPCVIFVVAPSSLFVRRLWKMGALWPHFFVPIPEFLADDTLLWLGQRHGFPLFRGEKMYFSYERHDTLYKLIGYWLLWAACIVGQAVSLLLYILLLSPLFVVHAPLWLLWFFFACYLYQIKMMSVGKVWTLWFRVWRSKDLKKNGTGRLDSTVLVDTEIMNESLFAAFFFETVPHLILQAVNNQFLNKWSSVAYFSTTLSVFNCINGLYRSMYYIYWLQVDFADIPLEISIGTVTLSLDKATHLEGLEFKHDYHLLTRGEVEMIFLNKDNRFVEISQLLRDPSAIRSHDYYGNGHFHLLPQAPREETAKKPSFLAGFSMNLHLGREKLDDDDPRYQWLVQLGAVVMEWENPETPVLSDLFTVTIMKAFRAHGIVHERDLHSLLVRLRDPETRRAFVGAELGLAGRLYGDILVEYFSRSWARLEAEGKGLDYVYEMGSKEEEEERMETFSHDPAQDMWRSVDESGHALYDPVPADSPTKPPAGDERLPPPIDPASPRQLPAAPFTPSAASVASFFSARPSAPPAPEAAALDAVVLHDESEEGEADQGRPSELRRA